MKKIFKFKIEAINKQTLTIPKDHKFLAAKIIDNVTCLYFLADQLSIPVDVDIHLLHEYSDVDEKKLIYLDSVTKLEVVFHIFEEK